jgi:hypothetical protein
VATVNSGTAQTVTFSAAGLPTGATATFSPTSVTSGASSTLTIATTSSTPAGSYAITVTGTGTSVTRTATYTLTVTGSGGSTCTSTQLLANPGFESGSTSWTATSGVITSSSSQAAHGGSYKAWLDGYGSTHTDSVYQSVTLPSGCTTYALTFYLHIDTAETTTSTAYDTLKVQAVNSSGTVLATLATYSNLNAASGYVLKTLSFSAYAGQTVRVNFLGVEDSSLQTSFVVDDTALTVS